MRKRLWGLLADILYEVADWLEHWEHRTADWAGTALTRAIDEETINREGNYAIGTWRYSAFPVEKLTPGNVGDLIVPEPEDVCAHCLHKILRHGSPVSLERGGSAASFRLKLSLNCGILLP